MKKDSDRSEFSSENVMSRGLSAAPLIAAAVLVLLCAVRARAYDPKIGEDGRLEQHLDKHWGLQFVVPPGQPGALTAEGENRVPDFPPDVKPDPAAVPSGPPLAFPDTDPERWGRFTFWNGLWWAQNFIQGEIQGAAVERPKKGIPSKTPSVWLKCDFTIPDVFLDKRISFFLDGLRAGDWVLFVNRKRAGEIRRPSGEVDVTGLVTVGKKNEFLLFGTCNGWNLPPVAYDTYKGPKKGDAYNPNAFIWGNQGFMLLGGPPKICGSDAVRISDIFANTSWRGKKLIVETEFESVKPLKGRYHVDVKDRDGKTVKTLDTDIQIGKGVTLLKPEIPWADPVTWETGRGYLYTLEAKLTADGKTFSYPSFRFGFREIWRQGREIMMNGHRQAFRTVYNFGANKWGAEFLSRIGYNCIHYSHTVEIDPRLSIENLYDLAEQGIAAVVPTSAFGYHDQGTLWGNMEVREDFGRLMTRNLRKYRNIPSIAMCYFGVNNIVPRWSMEAQWLGGGGSDGDRSKLADWMAAKGRETNPNVLFFSHADGNCADVASHNLYLNFTPLQEREQWLEKWNFNGQYPYQAAEFGYPYFQCWYAPGMFSFTEYAAMYFGERAYTEEAEPLRLMRRVRPTVYIRRVQFPLYWEFIRNFVVGTTRGWRVNGLNGGLVWFNLEEGYGMPGWDWKNKLWNQYAVNYGFKEKVPDRPEWLWPSYDIFRDVNQDFLGFIGGDPKFTDKTHAYKSGEKVKKNLVFFWDHFRPSTFSAEWTATLGGKVVGVGTAQERLEDMDRRLVPVVFDAPAVSVKTKGEITAVFRDSKGAELSRDSFVFEVYPPASRDWSRAPEVLLFDPDGESEEVLKDLGISRYRKIKSFEEVKPADKRLVIGRNALSRMPFSIRPEDIENGLRMLILPQEGNFWKSVGLGVHDGMSRVQFLRDTVSPAFKGIGKDELHDWRGAPAYGGRVWDGQTYGSCAPASGPRGPRWLRDMTVAGINLQSPDVVGFIPRIEGEFDMNYSSLLSFYAKKGAVTFCTLDFEHRVATDPAAAKTADAVFADFLLGGGAECGRRVLWSGTTASNLLHVVSCPAEELKGAQCPADSVVVVGPDSLHKVSTFVRAAKEGANVLFYCPNKTVVETFKFKTKPVWDVYRVPYSKTNELLRGIGPANLRWRDFFDYSAFTSGPKGSKIDMGGMFSEVPFGKGRLVFCQLDPTYFRRRFFPWESPSSPLLPLPDDSFAQVAASYTNNWFGDNTGGDRDTFNMLVEMRTLYDKWAKTESPPSGDDMNNRKNGYSHIESSVQRMYQLYARLLTNLGAYPGRATLERILWTKDYSRSQQPPAPPLVIGAHLPPDAKRPEALDIAVPGETSALAGRPKTDVAVPGTDLKWSASRGIPRKDGFCSFGDLIPEGNDGVGVILYAFETDVTAGDGCRLRLTPSKDVAVRVFVNSKRFDLAPDPNRKEVLVGDLPVNPGKNRFVVKVAAKRNDNLWISTETTRGGKPRFENVKPGEESCKASLYGYPAFRWFDPYKFTYW